MKVDIGPGIRNHTIQYRNKQVLHFLPQMSTGSEQDLITLINVPVLVNYCQPTKKKQTNGLTAKFNN